MMGVRAREYKEANMERACVDERVRDRERERERERARERDASVGAGTLALLYH